MTGLSAWLVRRGAQHDVVRWAEPFGDDVRGAWQACPRGDWLLGIAARAGVAPAHVARGALAVARFGLEDVADHALPVAGALERAEAAALGALAGEGGGRPDPALERDAAVFEAASEGAGDPAHAAILLAVACALRALGQPADAASVPALVAQAAVFSAGDCAMTAALGYAQRRGADLVRASVPEEDVVGAVTRVARAERGP